MVTVFHLSPFTNPKKRKSSISQHNEDVLCVVQARRVQTLSKPNNKSTKRCPTIEPGHTIPLPNSYILLSACLEICIFFFGYLLPFAVFGALPV